MIENKIPSLDVRDRGGLTASDHEASLNDMWNRRELTFSNGLKVTMGRRGVDQAVILFQRENGTSEMTSSIKEASHYAPAVRAQLLAKLDARLAELQQMFEADDDCEGVKFS